MGEDLMVDERLIIVKQLPVIEERLKIISEKIKKDTDMVLALEVNEETVKQAKAVRAEMNKAFTTLEDERKRVKNEIAAPYLALEEKYKELISAPFREADTALKEKIDAVEKLLKDAKEDEVRQYFDDLAASLNVDFVTYEDTKINVTLSASMKSLREKAKEFIEKVAEETEMIKGLADADEVMTEYLIDLNAARAIKAVKDRHDAIAQQQAEREKREQIKEQLEMSAAVVEAAAGLAPPKVAEKKEEEFELSFTVVATMEKLKALKNFLTEGGYKYE